MLNLSIDLGNTITSKKEVYPHIFPNAIEVISKLRSKFDKIYIISRVNSEQRERALEWFEDTNFLVKTGINPLNVYFCFDRRDKAIFCRALEINCMIDDRIDVMRHLDYHINKLIFNPNRDFEFLENMANYTIVKNWAEIGEYFKV